MGVKPAKEGREWLDRQGRQDDGLGTFSHCRHGSLLHSTAHSIYRQWKELAALERPSVNHLIVAVRQHIADWLNNLGMFEYGLPFAENHADSRVVCEFKDQDLKVR